MTLHWAYGYDGWSKADFQQQVDNIDDSDIIVGQSDRFGGTGAIKVNGTGSYDNHYKYITKPGSSSPGSTNPIILGSAWKVVSGNNSSVLFLGDGGKTHEHAKITFTIENVIKIYSNENNVETLRASISFNTSTWFFWEVEFYPHSTSGYFRLKINNIQVFYDNTSGRWYNAVSDYNTDGYMESYYFSLQHYEDDTYSLEKDATTPNDFLGDCTLEVLRPDSNGTTNNGTPSAGSNYECVDDVTNNADTDYVTLDAVNEIELYSYPNLSVASATIHAVITRNVARKLTAGARSIQHLVRTNSTNYTDGSDGGMGSEYSFAEIHYWMLNPDDSLAWGVADINALQTGIKITA